MFYEEQQDQALRFGDILQGYVFTAPTLDEPTINLNLLNYTIKVQYPLYYVVMTPCCSIGYGTISLTPLIIINHKYFDNPYFAKDLTNINRTMFPENTVSPQVWQKFPEEMKQVRLLEGEAYALLEFFIYEGHELLQKYPIGPKQNKIQTNYYMIDFRNIYRLDCKRIQSPEHSPLESKILQVTVEVRNELRDKLADYFYKRPKEDLIAIES